MGLESMLAAVRAAGASALEYLTIPPPEPEDELWMLAGRRLGGQVEIERARLFRLRPPSRRIRLTADGVPIFVQAPFVQGSPYLKVVAHPLLGAGGRVSPANDWISFAVRRASSGSPSFLWATPSSTTMRVRGLERAHGRDHR